MKTCPFCDEQIKVLAKKCRYCGSWLNGPSNSFHEDISNDKHLLQLENKLLAISCFILGIAVIWIGGYGYYMFSRVAIFIIMLFLFIKNYKLKPQNESKLWLYGITGLIYNPLLSISLTSFLWIVIDLIAMVLFYQKIKVNKSTLQ